MIKKYRIYERVETSLETETVYSGYSSYKAQSILFRTFDYEDWDRSRQMSDGFDSLEDAEKFLEENIEKYGFYTIIAEYTNNAE